MFVDIFRAIVAVKFNNHKRELGKQIREGIEQIGLGNSFGSHYHLPLSDLINGIDIINTFLLARIALMDAIDANIAWLALELV